jgi:hypothetical protein
MIESDKKQFLSVINAVMSVYGKEVSPTGLQVWWAALEEYPFNEVTRAFTSYVKSADSGTFPPKPADIIRMIDGTVQEKSVMAWSKVMEGIRHAGAYRSVCFDDPIINLVLQDMGGWPKICGSTVDESQFLFAEFNKKYMAYSARGKDIKYPAILMGISEEQNRIAGFKPTPPILIGNPQKAQLVLDSGSDKSHVQITSGKVADFLLKNIDFNIKKEAK